MFKIIQDPSNPKYIYVVQFQTENMEIPESKDFANMQDAMQFCIGTLSPMLHQIAFFSVTRRLA